MKEVVAGYDITRYATAPNHGILVQKVYNAIKKKGIKEYIEYVNSIESIPVTFEMVEISSREYNVDPILLTAIMMVDSRLGSKGKGKRLKNAGNVGNFDDGTEREFPTWQAGVNAVAEWLSKHKIK